MNTPAVASPTTASSSALQAGKQADASADVPFNQVLSREIAGRDNSGESNNASPKETANANAPSQAPAKTGKTTDKQKSKDSTDADQADGTAATAVAPTTPTDMLALVANIGQMNTPQKDAAVTTTDLPSEAGRPAVDAKLAAATGTADLKARIDGKDLAVQAQAADNNAKQPEVKSGNDFASVMQQAADVGNAGKLQATRTELASASLVASDPNKQEIAMMPTAAALAPLQAALNGTQAMVGHVPEKLTPQVGSPAWDQALGQKVVWMVAGAQQSASLTLNPPDLGPLQVVLNVSNSQANATFIAAQPEVRQALEAALPKLREMMGDAGIQLGQTTISSGGASQHGGSGEQQQRTSRSFEPVADSTETTISVARGRTISSGQGMVDTFA